MNRQMLRRWRGRVAGSLHTGKERGMATVEYAIVLVAAAGLAGVLVAILQSDTVRNQLTQMITSVLNVG